MWSTLLLAAVCATAGVYWYFVAIAPAFNDEDKKAANVDFDVYYMLSYLVWLFFVTVVYALLTMWLMLADDLRGVRPGTSTSAIVPWAYSSVAIVGASTFVAFVAVSKFMERYLPDELATWSWNDAPIGAPSSMRTYFPVSALSSVETALILKTTILTATVASFAMSLAVLET